MRSTVHETLSRSKGQGHKVMRRSSTKTSNISSKRYSVVEVHLSSLIVLSNRHNFSPFIRNRDRWTRWWGSFYTRSRIDAISAHAY